jgi:hypothetical protein
MATAFVFPDSSAQLLIVGGAAGYQLLYHDLRASSPYHWLAANVAMPLLRLLDPEDAHNASA